MPDIAVATEEQIIQFRNRIREGGQLTEDELRAGLAALRAKRRLAAEQATTKKSKAAPARSAEELMGLFKGQATSNGQ